MFVEEDEVEALVLYCIYCVIATKDRRYFVALALEEEDMGFEQVDFIVCPEDLIYLVCTHSFGGREKTLV